MQSALSSARMQLQQGVRGQAPAKAEQRKQRLQQVIDMLVAEKETLVAAIAQDYSGRCQAFSTMTDIVGSLASLKYARDHLDAWLDPYPTEVMAPYDQMGGDAYIQPQPKGVVAIMGTWNCPLYTVFSPMACALAAGNHVMVKPSDYTPHTAAAIAQAMRKHLDPNVFGVITGDVAVSVAFAHEPWDHLVFTGSTATGKKIMQAAAQNLVPVTLELGGKSPAILGHHADVEVAARRLAIAKGNNGGQICISPDTVYVPKSSLAQFVQSFMQHFNALYPSIDGNHDVVPLVNDTQHARVLEYVQSLREAGIEMVHSHPFTSNSERRLPTTIVINPPASHPVSQEELFGPMLVVRTYDALLEVIEELAQQAKPLALYVFTQDESERTTLLSHTTSGGVTVNDAMHHAGLHNAPFGGVGASGMGYYHGEYGFREFSHLRSVFVTPQYDFRAEYGLLPPYTEHFAGMMDSFVTKE